MADSLWGVEANYLHRFMTCHDGGTVRDAPRRPLPASSTTASISRPATTPPTLRSTRRPLRILAESYWRPKPTTTSSARRSDCGTSRSKAGGCSIPRAASSPGINCQNFRQNVNMGPELSPNPSPSGTGSVSRRSSRWPCRRRKPPTRRYASEFSPIIEMRPGSPLPDHPGDLVPRRLDGMFDRRHRPRQQRHLLPDSGRWGSTPPRTAKRSSSTA